MFRLNLLFSFPFKILSFVMGETRVLCLFPFKNIIMCNTLRLTIISFAKLIQIEPFCSGFAFSTFCLRGKQKYEKKFRNDHKNENCVKQMWLKIYKKQRATSAIKRQNKMKKKTHKLNENSLRFFLRSKKLQYFAYL